MSYSDKYFHSSSLAPKVWAIHDEDGAVMTESICLGRIVHGNDLMPGSAGIESCNSTSGV